MSNFSRTQAVGHHGERLAFDRLSELNYEPRLYPNFGQHGVDLRVDDLQIEVKYAHPTNRISRGMLYRRWQWLIHPTTHNLLVDYVLILIAETAPNTHYYFVLPGSVVNNRCQIQITSHPLKYRGWLAEWLNRWDLISYLQNGVYRNGGPLFHLMGVS